MNKTARHLFVDDHDITEIEGLQRTLNQVDKYPENPVIKPTEPWEGDGMWAKNSTIYDSAEGLFKIWYNSAKRTGFATSADGINWDKPNLGIVEDNGSTKNN